MRTSGTKVSVVVPTYNTGARLAGLIASLDAQSLPAADYELLLVDDGSTDDTFDRLQSLAAERDNVWVARIDNTGWPGRARNIGTAQASGEYVLYLDHDDRLFPEALQRMYDYASANAADVLLAKEVKTRRNTPGWLTFGRNQPRVTQVDRHVLQSMTPHKLYRRQFLREHQIAFPEGKVRLEDHRFNAHVFACTDAVAVLADYPCYQWVIHESNSNRTKADPAIYWPSFDAVLDTIDRYCADSAKRARMLARWYKYIVLDRLVARHTLLKDHIQQQADYLQARFEPSIDALLAPSDRLRSALYRARDYAALDRLARLERGVALAFDRPGEHGLAFWSEGALRVRVSGTVVLRSGRPYPLRRRDGRLVRLLPGVQPRQPLPQDTLDLTDALSEAVVECTVRARSSGVEWPLPGRCRLDVAERAGEDVPVFDVDAVLDPATAALGQALAADVWDVYVRVAAFGHTPLRKVAARSLVERPALLGGRSGGSFRAEGGTLALDVGWYARTLVGAARPTSADTAIGPGGTGAKVTVWLPQVHVRGDAALTGSMLVKATDGSTVAGGRLPARIVAERGRARLEFAAPAQAGSYRLRAEFDGRASARPMTLVVDAGGTCTLTTMDDPS
jgi:glycosyltransferase involved in cell wall biosynthesis